MLKARNVWKLLGHRGNVRKECIVNGGRLTLMHLICILESDFEWIV